MQEYLIPFRPEGPGSWEDVPSLAIDQFLRPVLDGTQAGAKLCWSPDRLHVLLYAKETQILRRFTGEYDPVWQDSCLEMFFCPVYGDGRYFNIECNPNGAVFWGFGTGREDRIRLHPDHFRELFQLETFLTEDGWGVRYSVPVEVIRLFFPGWQPETGRRMRANFYKCGDDKEPGHELMWSRITNGVDDFHQSAFFGELLFG